MSRHGSWQQTYAYCAAHNKNGEPCGNKVPTLPSGVYVRSAYCHVHRKRASSLSGETR